MREILFRGKCQTGEWVYGGFLNRNGKPEIIDFDRAEEGGFTFCTPVDPTTVGQFTGLLDKHGRKIFEGDIVVTCPSPLSISDGGDTSKRLVVNSWVFTDMCLTAMCKKSSKREKFYKIVGNIHEGATPCTSAIVE